LLRIVRLGLPAQPLDQLAQQQKVDVAIDEARAGRALRFGGCSETQPGLVARLRRRQRHIRRKAGEMCKQIANGDIALAALELGNVVGDLVVQPELTLLEQLHQ